MARVIKVASVVPRALTDARAEAAQIVATAQEQASALLAEAKRAADQLGAEAREHARAEAAASLVAAANARDALLLRSEGELLDVALAAAARIVEGHVALGAEQVSALVRATLERARRASDVTVLLHPEELGALDGVELPPNVALVADATLARGDVVVRSELGTVDARVATKLAAVRAALGAR